MLLIIYYIIKSKYYLLFPKLIALHLAKFYIIYYLVFVPIYRNFYYIAKIISIYAIKFIYEDVKNILYIKLYNKANKKP